MIIKLVNVSKIIFTVWGTKRIILEFSLKYSVWGTKRIILEFSLKYCESVEYVLKLNVAWM